jgi:hypothetical protein
MANPIKCVACKGTHKTIAEARSCHMQNQVFSDQPEVRTKVLTKAPIKKPVRHEPVPVKKFTSKDEALEFIQNNPGSRLTSTVSVKYVNGVQEKTYTVIL